MLAQRQGGHIGGGIVRRVAPVQSQIQLDDACRGIPHPILCHSTIFQQRQQQGRVALTTQLIDAGGEQARHSPGGVEVLDAPRTGRERLSEHHGVMHEPEVAEDHAVEPELVAQEVGDEGAVEGEADLFNGVAVAGEADRHPVVRHDRCGTGGDRCAERHQVILEPATRIDLLAAVGEVRIFAVELRTAAGEVLDGCRNAVAADLRALQSLEEGGEQSRGQHGIGAEALRLTRPTGVRGEVHLRMQRHPDAHRPVVVAHDAGEGSDQIGIVERAERDRLRPLRDAIRTVGRAHVLQERVARVAGEDDRQPRSVRGRDLLQATQHERRSPAGEGIAPRQK